MIKTTNKNKGGRPKTILTLNQIDEIGELSQRLTIEQIADYLGIGQTTFYEIQNTLSNSRFIFKGLRHNIDSIKSTAGITHLWIEEADTLSASS